MIVVPRAFADIRTTHEGEAGRRWVAQLPALVEELCQQWGLHIDDATQMHGDLALVVLVHRGDEPCILKVSWLEEATSGEGKALETWDGRGAVRLFAANPEVGALLLERLDWMRTLRNLELLDAAVVAGQLVRRLSVPASTGIRRLTEVADRITGIVDYRQEQLGRPIPQKWIDEARDLAQALGGRAGNYLVHADLYYGNVLAGTREPWLAVDPKPVSGDPEFSVPELLWDRIDEVDSAAGVRHLLAAIIENGELDKHLARGWAIVRCVDYWLWGLANGLTEDPKRCERVLQAV